jgi:peptidyl-prolyl cis-trans isomerase C
MTCFRFFIWSMMLLLSVGPFAAAWALPEDSAPATDKKDMAPKEPRVVAARVNGFPIYEDDVDRLAEMNFSKFKRFQSDEPPPEVQADMRKRAVQDLIAVELLTQAGRKLDIPDLEDRIEKSLKEKKSLHRERSVDQSDPAVRESVRRTILVTEYLKYAGVSDPAIPETRIREYYDKNKENFKRKDYVHVRHILVQIKPDAGPEEKTEARKKIDKAREEILSGRDFPSAAKEYSQDNAASAGGDIGYRERGFMPQEFEDVAFSIEKNKLSEVVETKFGYHILEVIDRKPAGIPPFEDLRDFLEKYLKREESKKKKAALVESLSVKANIEINK